MSKFKAYITSRQGLHDVGVLAGAVFAFYKALQAAGVV